MSEKSSFFSSRGVFFLHVLFANECLECKHESNCFSTKCFLCICLQRVGAGSAADDHPLPNLSHPKQLETIGYALGRNPQNSNSVWWDFSEMLLGEQPKR